MAVLIRGCCHTPATIHTTADDTMVIPLLIALVQITLMLIELLQTRLLLERLLQITLLLSKRVIDQAIAGHAAAVLALLLRLC